MKKFLHYSLLVLSCGALMLTACNKQVPLTPSSTEESSEPAPDPGPGPEPGPEPVKEYEVPKSFDEAQFFVFDNAMPVLSEDEMEISMLLIETGLYSITGVDLVSYTPEYRELLNGFEVYECVEEQYQLYSNDVFTYAQERSYKEFVSGYVGDYPNSSFETIGYIDARETKTYGVSYNYREARTDALEFWSLDEIPEYIELQTNYTNLETQVAELNTQIESLNNELTSLREFKSKAERAEKEAKIAEFYMLSDEDKKDVVDNIDKYSLDDIEAKLSVICFRNKVSFKTEEDNQKGPTTYNLGGDEGDDSSTPAWVKAALETAKTLN